jgi:hypothetical protein
MTSPADGPGRSSVCGWFAGAEFPGLLHPAPTGPARAGAGLAPALTQLSRPHRPGGAGAVRHGGAPLQLPEQEHARLEPVAFDGACRHAEQCGNPARVEAAVEAQIDHLAQARVQRFELHQCCVEREEFIELDVEDGISLAQRQDLSPCRRAGASCAGVLDGQWQH